MLQQDQITNEQPKLEDPREYWKNFPEAPFSDSFRWVDTHGFEHLTTIRGWTFTAMLQSMQKAEQLILDMGGKPIVSRENRQANQPPAPSSEPPAAEKDPNEPRYVDPAELDLKPGQHVFTIKELYRDKTNDGKKYMLKIVLAEPYEYGNGKWGISYFKQEGAYAGWAKWELGKRYAPLAQAARVIVEDPKPGGKFANIVAFLPAL